MAKQFQATTSDAAGASTWDQTTPRDARTHRVLFSPDGARTYNRERPRAASASVSRSFTPQFRADGRPAANVVAAVVNKVCRVRGQRCSCKAAAATNEPTWKPTNDFQIRMSAEAMLTRVSASTPRSAV